MHKKNNLSYNIMNIPEELLDRDLVFHFSKPYVAMENILHDKMIRFSSLVHMNDPYEYKIKSLGLTVRGNMPNKKTVSEAFSMLKNTILYKSKVVSLVRSKKDNIKDDYKLVFTKPRLWAQYAEAQYGVCLIFSLTAFLQILKKYYPKITVYHDFVEYDLSSDKRNTKTHLQYDLSLTPYDNVRNHININQRDVYFRKYEDFGDESEYRIVLIDWNDSENKDIYIDIQEIIRGVILGERFHPVYERLIYNLTNKLGVNLYRIVYSTKKVTLNKLKHSK